LTAGIAISVAILSAFYFYGKQGDSLQLAAALIGADHDPVTLEIVYLDARLTSAARREGFVVRGA